MTEPYAISTANNARFLDPEDLASFFVAPPCFRDLFSLRHQLLVGPRGSGKTTLLKMLRVPAVGHWKTEEGPWARANLPFVGIFIPADTSWTETVRVYAQTLPDTIERSYTRAAQSLLLLRSIVDAFSEKTRQCIETSETLSDAFKPCLLDTHGEVALCKTLRDSWNMPAAIPTFRGLRSALSREMMLLGKVLRDDLDRGTFDCTDQQAKRVSLPVSETVSHAIDVFEEITNTRPIKWGLLFDELEITPQWFQEDVLRRFRSTDSRLIFKVAITPCGQAASQMGGVTQPHRVDDYEEIPLWYEEGRDALKFCNAFWLKLLQHRGTLPISPTTVLGESVNEDFEPSIGKRSGRYDTGGVWLERLRSLAAKDPTFRDYLARRNVNINDGRKIDRKKMDSVLRKVAPVAIYRDYFLVEKQSLRFSSERSGTRARKLVSLYSGAKNIFRITEGNPRWYLSLVGQLLERWERQNKTITRAQQAAIVEAFAERFLATVAAYPNPIPKNKTKYSGLTVTRLLERLGDAAFHEVVGGAFQEEPRLAFRIDVDDPTINALVTVAINAGALVLLDSGGAPNFVSQPNGRTVRLSYHLAPRYRIPLRSGRRIALSKILSPDGERPSAEQTRIDFNS